MGWGHGGETYVAEEAALFRKAWEAWGKGKERQRRTGVFES